MQDVAQACLEAIDDAYPGERAVLVGCSIGSSMARFEQPALFNRYMLKFLTAHALFPGATVRE
jgi:hypothetical protein